MITFIILCSIVVLFIGYTSSTNDDATQNVCAFFSLVFFVASGIYGGCCINNYACSLELEGDRQDAITAKKAAEKGNRYSRKELTAEGNLEVGKVSVRYGTPMVRHKLEEQAIEAIKHYNKELGRMKGYKKGWLWTPAWGISDEIDKMKPIEIPRTD